MADRDLVQPGDYVSPQVMRDAIERAKGQQVPLVMYKGGERIVLGRAYIESDGSIVGQIAKDFRAAVNDIFSVGIGEVSIDPRSRPL